jgi:hypothetical protein
MKQHRTNRGIHAAAKRGFFAVATMIVSISCVDTTPVSEVHSRPLVQTDAGEESACLRCQKAPDNPGPGCGTELANCFNFPSCKDTAECAMASGCYELGSTMDWTSCAIACGEKYNLGGDAAGLGAATVNFNCFQKQCSAVCDQAGH